jgi:hypothetical protein
VVWIIGGAGAGLARVQTGRVADPVAGHDEGGEDAAPGRQVDHARQPVGVVERAPLRAAAGQAHAGEVAVLVIPVGCDAERVGLGDRPVVGVVRQGLVAVRHDPVEDRLADAQANGDYYTEGGSAVMPWLATDRARTFFGLGPRVGAQVSRGTMAALLNGRHPATGGLIRRPGPDGTKVGGSDVVMNPAPKSVSVLWAVADDELRRAIETEVYLSAHHPVSRLLHELPMVRDR